MISELFADAGVKALHGGGEETKSQLVNKMSTARWSFSRTVHNLGRINFSPEDDVWIVEVVSQAYLVRLRLSLGGH